MINILFLSKNEDLKKQIELQAEDFCIVCNNPDVVLTEDEKDVEKYDNLPVVLITQKEEVFENAITIQKPFLLKSFFEKLYSAQKIFENNENYSLKWGSFELFINKKVLINSKFESTYKLTEKEVDVLKYFYKKRGAFVSRKELLENVWGYNPEMSTHTTETHIYRLRQKVEPSSEAMIKTLNGEYTLVI